METKNEIRPYGPGKFSTILDSYVYKVSLNGGCEDEVGDSSYSVWYGLMLHGRTIFTDHNPNLESLNEAEREQLTSCAGVIICEHYDGFVTVAYYDTKEEIERDWDEICQEAEEE